MIDQTDKEILTLLEENSRMKVKEIAEQVHLSAPTVSQRLIKLEEDGVIKNYTLQTDLSKTGYPIHTFIFTTMISPSHTQYLAYIEGNKRHILNHYRTGHQAFLVTLWKPALKPTIKSTSFLKILINMRIIAY